MRSVYCNEPLAGDTVSMETVLAVKEGLRKQLTFRLNKIRVCQTEKVESTSVICLIDSPQIRESFHCQLLTGCHEF